jgi:quinoprotein glucose dehydrogenase
MFQMGRDIFKTAPSVSLATPAYLAGPAGEWRHYGSDIGGTRFRPLTQLNPQNVGKLTEAWRVRLAPAPGGATPSFEVTPLKIGNSVYVCTALNDILSLDAETGKLNWRFRANIDSKGLSIGACRGLAYFRVPGATGTCNERIITNTVDARLIALDAASGRRCQRFGYRGETSLQVGMLPAGPGYYYPSSAPTIVRGKIIVGGQVRDNQYWGEPSGVIRAYDAVTGRFAWAFDVGRPNDHGERRDGQRYTPTTPNSWAPMSGDESLGLVYAPTGSASPDYFGGKRRPFDEKYASAVIALDAETGAIRWMFQTAHHDLWDYDVASQPTLVDIRVPAGVQHALIHPTKRGEIFVLDRATGRPLTPVEEKPAPQNGIAPGERLSPTQPYSVGMPSFRGHDWHERDMWGVTAIDQLWCRIKFRQARYEGPLTPIGLTPSIQYPGSIGGMDWGGVSVDPERGLMVVNSARVGNYNRLLTRAEADQIGLKPSPGGKVTPGASAQANTPYGAYVVPFLSPLGIPCNAPPYGLLTVVDMHSGKVLWSKPLGTARDSGPRGLSTGLPIPMGLPNLGGSVTTRGGLVFIAASTERTFRAFDVQTGSEVWSARMPSRAQATPSSYWSNASGRQFVVIAVGGNKALQSKTADYIIAYAIPK